MFAFKTEQKIYGIDGLKIGGQPGQLPTVMIGSIFYHKDKIVADAKTGNFDRNKAEEILSAEQEISARTGNPRIVDVCASWAPSVSEANRFRSEEDRRAFHN